MDTATVVDLGRQALWITVLISAPLLGVALFIGLVIGILQATEALKYILGIGDSLSGRLLHLNLLTMSIHETRMQADPACRMCGSLVGAGSP